ncbi:MAG: hypothetical protein E7161_04490 [Firmicutes bacterium]|nr:hypothetical protein [Bacillota bacterium]
MKNRILNEIIRDLSDNYRDDIQVIDSLLEDVINDALFMSNRQHKKDIDTQLTLLKSNIKKAVKTIYLQRGTEDVTSNSQSGISNTYSDAMEQMQKDIIRQQKRILL